MWEKAAPRFRGALGAGDGVCPGARGWLFREQVTRKDCDWKGRPSSSASATSYSRENATTRRRPHLRFPLFTALLPRGWEDGKRAEADPGMDNIPEEGFPAREEDYRFQDLENPEEGKFRFSIDDLKELCRVGALAFNLMSFLMLIWSTVSPHWVQMSFADKVVYSSLWETCVEGACWNPGNTAGYLIYGRCFIVFAVVLSFFLNLMLLGFFFQFCSHFPLEYLIFAIMDAIAGISVFTGLLMYMLQMKSLEEKGPRINFLWPYFIVFICFLLFLYSAIIFILIHKEFCHTRCLRSPRVIPKDLDIEEEEVNLEDMESPLQTITSFIQPS